MESFRPMVRVIIESIPMPIVKFGITCQWLQSKKVLVTSEHSPMVRKGLT